MVGSKKYFQYETNDGTLFALLADESNTELAGGGVDLVGGTSVLFTLPGNVQPRYGRYVSADGLTVRKAYICNTTLTLTTPIVDPSSGLSLELKQIVSESISFPTGTDTGLLDGDAS